MTGNKNAWRAPLAGLASVAMIATMGVTALSANAAWSELPAAPTVTLGSNEVSGKTGQSMVDAIWANRSVSIDSGANNLAGWYDSDGNLVDLSAEWTGAKTYVVKAAKAGEFVKVVYKNIKANNEGTGPAQRFDNVSEVTADGAVVNVPNGSTLEDYVPVDQPDKQIVTDWVVTYTDANGEFHTENYTTEGLKGFKVREADDYQAGTAVTITPNVADNGVKSAEQVEFKANSSDMLPAGYAADGTVDNSLMVDAFAGSTVKAPGVMYGPFTDQTDENATSLPKTFTKWQSTAGTFAFGTDATVKDGVVYTPADEAASVLVVFGTTGSANSYVPVLVRDGSYVTAPAAPSKKGHVFKGWKYTSASAGTIDSAKLAAAEVNGYVDQTTLDSVPVHASKTSDKMANNYVAFAPSFKASSEVRVWFNYGTYEGAPKETYKDYAPTDLVVEPEIPTREGYVFDGWTLADGTKFDFTTTLAGEQNGDFTLTAKWVRAYQDTALAALKYVDLAKVASVTELQGNDAKYFKNASDYVDEYKAVAVEYAQANWDALNDELESSKAAEIVSKLQAIWKQLRFDNGNVDSVLDGKTNDKATAVIVYRLATKDGRQHLLTTDENEVKSLTNGFTGVGGWNLETVRFRVIKGGQRAKWIAGSEENGKRGFAPLVNKVTRLYNPILQEHLYTADATEVKVLSAGDWSVDSQAADLYVPAQYTTGTGIVRFYNPATGLHFYTADQNEIAHWTGTGVWNNEGTKFYAL